MASADTEHSLEQLALDTRGHLRKDVLNLIKPFRDTTSRPPFTLRDLIVFALTACEEENVTILTIVHWILDHFTFYADPKHHSIDERTWRTPGEPNIVIEGFVDALMNFDTPVNATTHRDTDGLEVDRYSLQTNAARLYLTEYTQPVRKGTFPFLDLPAELRNRIYSLLFVYDTPLAAQQYYTKMHFHNEKADRMVCMALSVIDPPSQLWLNSMTRTPGSARPVVVDSPVSILALTATCKQIFKESNAIFYGLNTFAFEDQEDLAYTGQRMGRNFQHLRRLHLKLWIDTYQRSISWLDELKKELRRLKQLSLARLRLDKLILSHEWYCPEQGREYCDECDETGVHDRQFEEIEDLFEPIISMAKRAKSLEIGYVPGCTSLRRFIMRRVAHRPKVKMLCCSDVAEKERDEIKWF
ncbi:hypothetical protein AC579_7051 [Pseudocercospora musae]|uniref:Fork-head domain-containing protein n=1 Tax=Pseudocercospora musae TaxID=113226 RepID=A0A139IAN6_9PEZI|nr:hypothetical protein AC579_7051 [Pseudocercospora musae]